MDPLTVGGMKVKLPAECQVRCSDMMQPLEPAQTGTLPVPGHKETDDKGSKVNSELIVNPVRILALLQPVKPVIPLKPVSPPVKPVLQVS